MGDVGHNSVIAMLLLSQEVELHSTTKTKSTQDPFVEYINVR